MIKIEHSVFALPFALLGMIWAVGWPGARVFTLIVIAMVTCRSSAMAFNRIVDRSLDAANPRTSMRALPAGLLQPRHANLFFYGSCALFFIAAWALNPLAFALSPVALGVTLLYSLTKRFTPLCHLILGLSLGIAPAAAWVAATGALDWRIVPLSAAVMCWTAGFDILYSLQDEEFDREHRLRSLPETLGKPKALLVSRALHAATVVLLGVAGWAVGAGMLYFLGALLAAFVLVYEQSLVKPDDLSRVNLAFFTLNGYVSIGVFAFALADRVV